MMLKLTEIITKDFPTLDKDRPLLDAIENLNRVGAESICIDENGKLLGSLSHRDVLFRVGTQRLRAVAPESLYISGFFKEFPANLSNDTSIRRAAKLMLELSSATLPMYYGETLLGVVFRKNMLKLMETSSVTVSSVMRKNFPIIRPHDRVIHARKLLLENNITIIPIVSEEGRLLGTVTDREVLNSLIEFQKYVPEKHQKSRIRQLAISSAMKVGSPTIGTETSLREASATMFSENLQALLVIDENKVLGTVSAEEILQYVVGSFPEE
jgi:CBS domain-containing protein